MEFSRSHHEALRMKIDVPVDKIIQNPRNALLKELILWAKLQTKVLQLY